MTLIKRFLKKTPILLGVAAAAVALSSGTSTAATTTSVSVIGSGSDTTYYMMNALGDLYGQSPGCNPLAATQPLDGSCPNSGAENKADFENYYHDYVVNKFPIGSSGGINQLCKKGLADPSGDGNNVPAIGFARSSRVPQGAGAGGSDCAGLRFVGYAKDAITWECFPGASNPCHDLTTSTNSISQNDLKGIFTGACSITDWSQVGGSSGAIDVYVPQAKSGTGISWAAYLGVTLTASQALDTCIPAAHKSPTVAPGQPGSWVSPENTNNLIHTNGDEANAIFPFSVGVYHFTYGANAFTGSDGSSLGKINGQQATDPNILSGVFPVSRFLFNAYCKGVSVNGVLKCGTSIPAAASVTKFIGTAGFLCKTETKHNDHLGNPILDPVTGLKYRGAPDGSGNPTGEIPNTINQFGFVPLKKQGTGTAGYCTTFDS
jgi:ABC-type phosphate transport system substrate-binding protein